MIPGLLSTVEDHYHHTFVECAEKHGYDWLLINYRGMRHPLKTTQPFSSFDYHTFEEVIIDVIKQNQGKRQIFIFGTSLGGHMTANLLANSTIDKNKEVAAVVALNPALDLNYSSHQLQQKFFGFYDWLFGISLRIFMKQS